MHLQARSCFASGNLPPSEAVDTQGALIRLQVTPSSYALGQMPALKQWYLSLPTGMALIGWLAQPAMSARLPT